jgi:hypothetical protein
MMMRTQRIRKLSPTSRRPRSGRAAVDPLRGGRRRAEAAAPSLRRTVAPRVRALPQPARPAKPKRPRPRHLRLVAVNARPRRRRSGAVVERPQLRLLRGRAPSLALPRRRAAVARVAPPAPKSRVAQLAFVMAMAAIGLVALATSVGQLVTSGM